MITVSGFEADRRINEVTLFLNDYSHTFSEDVDGLLVGPSGKSVIVMSDAGGDDEVCFIDLVLNDEGDELPDEEGASESLQARSWWRREFWG